MGPYRELHVDDSMSKSNSTGRIQDINGPIVTIRMPGIRNGAQVRIGTMGLYGEVIALQGDEAVVQAYESTAGIRPGEPVETWGGPCPWNWVPE